MNINFEDASHRSSDALVETLYLYLYFLELILAYGLVEKLQQGWMYSDGHRANLLNLDYQTFGYGIAISADAQEVYAVQLFSF